MSKQRVVEVRTYKLKTGSAAAFHALVVHQSMPLVKAANMDVVAYGQSLHDPDSYYLIRSYDSMEHLRNSQDAFYASDAWRQGPREAIIALIESDANAVMCLSCDALEAIRQSHSTLRYRK
jgi:hypothetical protein